MEERKSFTSLMDLAESHLSKTCLETNSPKSSTVSILNRLLTSSGSSFQVTEPKHKFFIPNLHENEATITNNLAAQVANTLKIRESKQIKELEEKQNDDKEKENVDEYIIDLTDAINEVENQITASNTNDWKTKETFLKKPKVTPIIIEDSIMNTKLKRKRISAFGKVLCAKFVPKPMPYKLKRYPTKIKVFKFNTLSPDDLATNCVQIKRYDVCEIFGLKKSETLLASLERAGNIN